MKPIFLDKLHRDHSAVAAAMRGSLNLVEKRVRRWEAHAWNGPAFAMKDGDVCLGVLCFTEDEADCTVTVNLAYVEPGNPMVLVRLLQALREKYAGSAFEAVYFSYHVDNSDMAKAAKALGCGHFSHTCRVVLPAAKQEST